MSGRAATDTVIPGRHALSVGNPGTAVPPGWAWLPLGQLAEMGTGHTPSRGVPAYWDGDVPWMGIRDARAHHGGTIWNTAQTITQAGLDNSSARLLPAGTVALSRTASVGYVVQLGRTMATSQDFVTWTCSTALNPQYLMRAIQAEGENIRSFGEGSTHTTIYFPELKALQIQTPPLSEQVRIVAKLDSLSPQSKQAHTELDAMLKLVRKYKMAVLRRMHDLSTRSAIRIRTLGEIASEIRNGLSAKPNSNAIGTRILRISSVRPMSVNMDDVRFYPPEAKIIDRDLLRAGDILCTRYNGNADLTGSFGLVKETTYPITYPDKLIRIRINPENDAKYIMYMVSAPQTRVLIASCIKTVAGQHGISGSDLKKLPLPLIAISQQQQIVRRIDHAFAAIDRLAVEAQSARDALDKLDQAILAKAFRGELVPQDPNDEPASVLLERIRAERAAVGPAPKRGRRPRGATA